MALVSAPSRAGFKNRVATKRLPRGTNFHIALVMQVSNGGLMTERSENIAVLIGNGLSIAFNPDLHLQNITKK